MKTIEEIYVESICTNCKNKSTELCEIKRRYDNTVYCENYDRGKEKRKKAPVHWQKW